MVGLVLVLCDICVIVFGNWVQEVGVGIVFLSGFYVDLLGVLW